MNDPTDNQADLREWLDRARSSLEHARATHPHVYFEELCFDAQQAAEKAVKAVLLHKGIPFPYIHDLDRLLQLLADSGENIGDTVRRAGELTRYTEHAIRACQDGSLNQNTGRRWPYRNLSCGGRKLSFSV